MSDLCFYTSPTCGPFHMLSKINRISTKEVDQIFKSSIFINSISLSFKFILTKTSNSPRISFIVPKTVSKSAVKRNTLRRVGYNALKKHITEFPAGLTGVFIFKKPEQDISVLENEIKEIIKKIRY